MAVTPKLVRRNGGNCICANSAQRIRDREFYDGTCKKGYCYSAKCRACGGELFGTGPVACPCEHPRWCRHRGMRERGHWDAKADKWVSDSAAVKPSSVKFRRNPAAFR